jgi:hypothetical protein
MTTPPNELEALMKMEARERDAMVATRVMGWKPPRIGVDNKPDFPMQGNWSYSNPPACVEDWRSDYHWRESTGSCWNAPHPFTTDTTWDYSVLCHVRETWDIPARERFAQAMSFIRDRNTRNSGFDQRWQPHWSMAYEPGDYSLAALLALPEQRNV